MLQDTKFSEKRVSLRDYYVSHFCNDESISHLMRIQNVFPKQQAILNKYFEFLSIFGEPPFYTFFIPVMFWCGLEREACLFCVMMSVTLYFTNNLKDMFACPRPPCPPLRRAGTASHSLEYGFPSSHTALGMTTTYHLCVMFSMLFPDKWWLIWGIGMNFIVQTAISRMYLGLHWLADLLGGFLVFGFGWLLQEAFLKKWIFYVMDHPQPTPALIFCVSHVLNIINVSPKDPCPCYEDTVRFFGAAAGATWGFWASRQIPLVVARDAVTYAEKGSRLFSLPFLFEGIAGVIVIAVCKTIVSVVSPIILKPLYIWLCGARLDSCPSVLRTPYRYLCCCVGILFGKSVWIRGMPAEMVDAPLVTKIGDEEEGNQPSGVGKFQVWSVRNHNHWFEWDIHTKSLAYIVVSYSATVLSPMLWSLFL